MNALNLDTLPKEMCDIVLNGTTHTIDLWTTFDKICKWKTDNIDTLSSLVEKELGVPGLTTQQAMSLIKFVSTTVLGEGTKNVLGPTQR